MRFSEPGHRALVASERPRGPGRWVVRDNTMPTGEHAHRVVEAYANGIMVHLGMSKQINRANPGSTAFEREFSP
jgi:hypothetical protein